MSDFEYLKARLPKLSEKAEIERAAKGSGVPYDTLLKLVNGQTTDPRISTVSRLCVYYRSRDSRRKAARQLV